MRTLSEVRKAPHRKTVGIELECLVSSAERDALQNKYFGFWYCGYDGSISDSFMSRGVEFVSQPLTVEWAHREIRRLANKVPAWRTNTSCGIHVHVNREWFTMQRANAVWKWMCKLADADLTTFRMLFGRHPNSYCRADLGYQLGSSRYNAVNVENKATTELRSFASGNERWLHWCVDFTVYLVENAKHLNVAAVCAYYDWWHAHN